MQQELKRRMRPAKMDYKRKVKRKVKRKLQANNIREVWRGMKTITGASLRTAGLQCLMRLRLMNLTISSTGLAL